MVLSHLVNTLSLTRESPSYSIVKDERARAEPKVYKLSQGCRQVELLHRRYENVSQEKP